MSTKDEIMGMPEGKSSEEIDAIMMEGEEGEESADDNLASEALKATEADSQVDESEKDKSAEDEATDEVLEEKVDTEELSADQEQLRAKDSKIASMKHTHRELELENAKLQGRLEAQAEMQTQTKVVEKSPLEIAMEAEGVTDPDDLEKPFTVLLEQQKWEKEQDSKASAETVSETQDSSLDGTIKALQETELSAAVVGEGLDLLSVKQYEDNLSKRDETFLRNKNVTDGSAVMVREYRKLVIARTIAAGGEDAKTLQRALKLAPGKPVTLKKTLKTEKDVDDLTTEGDDTTGDIESNDIPERLKSFVGSDFFKGQAI